MTTERMRKATTRCRCLLIARPHYVGDHDQAEQDAPPATVTIAYASGKTYVYQVADETRADNLRKVLDSARDMSGDFTPLP